MKSNPILWVEDDPDDQELIALALDEVGLADRPRFVPDGPRALDYLSSCGQDELPTAIILDFKLPMMDAPEILARLRQREAWSRIPVVIFTSSGPPRDSSCLGTEVVGKPVEACRFREAVQRLAQRWT